MTTNPDGEKSSGKPINNRPGEAHSIVNVDDKMERELEFSEYYRLMEHEGKIIEYQPLGVTDFPSVLIGFTEEQVYNEIRRLLHSLPLTDMMKTVHTVLRQNHVQYECKNLLGTNTYIFDFPQIEAGRLTYMEVRPNLIHPGFGLYSGRGFPDSTYDDWRKWARWLESWMTRTNLDKAIEYWRRERYSGWTGGTVDALQTATAVIGPVEVDPTADTERTAIVTIEGWTKALGRFIAEQDYMIVLDTNGPLPKIRAEDGVRGPIAEYIIELRDDGFSFTPKQLGDFDLYQRLTSRIYAQFGEVMVTAVQWGESKPATAENKQLIIEDWKEHIPTDYRIIVDMWGEGYTAKDIAEVEGVKQSAGTIGNVITAQRNKLATIYGRDKAKEFIPYHRT